MSAFYSLNFLRQEIARIIEPSLDLRRASLREIVEPGVTDPGAPATEDEIDDFLLQCPFEDGEVQEALLSDDTLDAGVMLSDSRFAPRVSDATEWSQVETWLAGDEWPFVEAEDE